MIGIIVAMDKELVAIEACLETIKKTTISNITILEGTLSNKDVVIVKSGIGKGYAAMATTILLEHYDIDTLINIGTAGGLKANQNILDAVISNQVVQHDFDTSAIDGNDGVGLYFPTDEKLTALCTSVLADMNVTAHVGLVASGDLFVAKEEDLQSLLTKFPEAACAEMEAGAIAQVCAHYGVAFTVLRSLSDVANQPDSHMDYLEYVEHAAARSAQFVKALLKQY